MSTGQQQAAQSATAAAILSEEKSYHAVQFAITGLADADFLSGISALVIQLKLASNHRLQQRLFEYLAATAKDEADKVEEQQREQTARWSRMQAAAQQSQIAPPLPQSYGILGGLGQAAKEPYQYASITAAQIASQQSLAGLANLKNPFVE